MAPNHVPTDQGPLQGQNIYTDPSYSNIFSSVDRYGTPSWDPQLNQQHSALAPNPTTQSWHHGAYPQQPFNTPSQLYANHAQSGLRAASPYQYGQFTQQPAAGGYASNTTVDPSLGLDPNAVRQQQPSPYQMPMRNGTPQNHASTVTPQALQHSATSLQNIRPSASPFQIPKTTSEIFARQQAAPAQFVKPVPVPELEVPKGRKSGGIYVVDQAALAKATKSTPLNKLVTLGTEPFHLFTNRTALPLYTARLSLKELKKAGADNKKLAKLSSSKSASSRALKSERKTSALLRETSDSDSYTDSSDEYTDSSDEEDEEPSPLPASRSDDPHAAVRYDTIKATWYPRASVPNSEKIKNSMRDIWEVLNTIQKRWRADSKAVTEAEDQKKTGELPVLKSRVASQRDLLQTALETALKHAHPDVLYHLGQIKPFLYLCYQFLANRFHGKDYDGPLSAAIYEVLSRCGTLTTELLEETKVVKALTSMKKHANDKHKAFVQQIIDGAAANSKKAKVASPPAETKSVKRPGSESLSAGISPAKKPKPSESAVSTGKKDMATTAASKTMTTTPGSLNQKRPGEKSTSTSAPVKSRVNTVPNKPSGIFASLNAASKKPAPAPSGPSASKASVPAKPAVAATKDKKPAVSTTSKPAFSFAQTMASLLKPKEQVAAPAKSEKQLPPETPEEKTKRLRKESRRHLRVTFRPDTSLVSIRYFDHAPEEDHGHGENLVRDAGDIGGEGRMFKQHKELDVDEDEDEPETDYRDWREPSLVDFSVVKIEERQRNYMPFGGGELAPVSSERESNIRRENATLMVFYADPNDIPSSPREPLEESAPAVTVTKFGRPPESCLRRCPQTFALAPTPDISNLENIFKQFATPVTAPTPAAPQPAPVQDTYVPPPASAPNVDLASILSALTAQTAPQPPPLAPVVAQTPTPQPPAGLDLNAIMSFMQAQAASGALPPPPPGFPPFPFAFPPQPPQQEPVTTAYQPLIQPQYEQQTNGSNKRQRDEANSNGGDRNQGKKQKKFGNGVPHKVLACRFFQKGTCIKGDNCTYIHDLN